MYQKVIYDLWSWPLISPAQKLIDLQALRSFLLQLGFTSHCCFVLELSSLKKARQDQHTNRKLLNHEPRQHYIDYDNALACNWEDNVVLNILLLRMCFRYSFADDYEDMIMLIKSRSVNWLTSQAYSKPQKSTFFPFSYFS